MYPIYIIQWFEDRKNRLETLDSGLRTLLKSLDAIIKQRKGMNDVALAATYVRGFACFDVLHVYRTW